MKGGGGHARLVAGFCIPDAVSIVSRRSINIYKRHACHALCALQIVWVDARDFFAVEKFAPRARSLPSQLLLHQFI